MLTKPILSNTQVVLHKILHFPGKLGMCIPNICLSTYTCPIAFVICSSISVIYNEGIQSLNMSDSYMFH